MTGSRAICFLLLLIEAALSQAIPIFPKRAPKPPKPPTPTLTRVSERQVLLRSDLMKRPIPKWSGPSLIEVEGNESREPLIRVYGPEGEPEKISFAVPPCGYVRISDFTTAGDGGLILVGIATDGSFGRGDGYLATISADRKKTLVTRLDYYRASAVTLAPNGRIWTIGIEHNEDHRKYRYNVLKQFDRGGKEITASIPIVRGYDGGPDASFDSHLAASSDRVGWLTNINEYLEFSMDGKELDRFGSPDWRPSHTYLNTLSLSPRGDVILGDDTGWDPLELGILFLNRVRREWIPLQIEKGRRPPRILGFDGMELVALESSVARGSLISRFRLPE